jgi:4-hydroxy-2-oxoheptanedioate aldolase
MNRLHEAILRKKNGPMFGAALYFYDPVFLEIAGYMGFDVVWIEMEHAGITFAEAADLCRMVRGTGMLSMIRVPDARRESVLKAAECGPDIIDLPMVETPQQLEELVRYARFAPLGARGFFSVSPALRYGIVDSVPGAQQQLNDQLSLLAQVETAESVRRVDELIEVPGVDLFIGPADLAASMGYPGQTAHPAVLEAAARVVGSARSKGKKVATACGPADFIHWARLGIDLLFCTNDISALKAGAASALQAAQDAFVQARQEPT